MGAWKSEPTETAKSVNGFLLCGSHNKEAIRTRYQPDENEPTPSEDDINIVYDIVTVRAVTHLMLDGAYQELRALKQQSTHETADFIRSTISTFLCTQRKGQGEQATYQLFADLLEVTNEATIQAFGDELAKGTYYECNNVCHALSNLKNAGTIDTNMELTIRKWVAKEVKGSVFMTYFGRVDDTPAFAAKARNWEAVNNILGTRVEGDNAADALAYATE
ncbi:uncharacterized protein BO97DRAFT_439949 [Aspergillus homomorphus CBS 101889]|uniref:Uncharacterized protein n=1 Tax=Aspergillus homomorphus (strain CBS 101889) TaxID=1450537 RepID=A0A395ICZ8_ASPHC|nr:hypothetical protein BO97DRAFT_439949 [Aspergillus homomorphus CBS 101889]RAL17043.1 hypothetical protein BO97DRAFT_439949 [Aspergillus homomorphus CBS 101889]